MDAKTVERATSTIGMSSAPGVGPEADTRVMARTVGLTFVTGAVLAQLWVLVPHAPGSREGVLELIVLAVGGVGVVMLAGLGDGLPTGAFHLILLAALGAVATAHLAAGSGRTGFSFFFLWLVPWVFFFMPRRVAVAHTFAIAVASGAVLTVESGASLGAAWTNGFFSVWLILMGTAVALGTLGAVTRGLSSSVNDRERQLRTMVDRSIMPTALVCDRGIVTRVNEPLVTLLGSAEEALLGVAAVDLGLLPAAQSLAAPSTAPAEQLVRRADGTSVWVGVATLPVTLGRMFTGRVLQLQDLTAHKRAEAEAAALEVERERAERDLITRAVRQETLVEFARSALSATDQAAVLARVSQVAAATLGVPLVSVLELADGGAEIRLVAGHGWQPALVRDLRLPTGSGSHGGYALDHGTTVSSLPMERRFEVHRTLKVTGAVDGISCPIVTGAGAFGTVNVYSDTPRVFTAEDVATLEMLTSIVAAAMDRHAAEQERHRHSVHDALTGLPNRLLLIDRLDMALDRAERARQEETGGDDGSRLAVLLIDIDQFKTVNDSLGHDAGDELLLALAPRLRSVVRSVDTVARLSGDEFAVLLTDLEHPGQVLELVDHVNRAWEEPFTIAGTKVHITASVGVSVLGAEPKTAHGLLQEADTAMYRAKEQGRGRVEMYDEQMRASAAARLELETAMRVALERDQFQVAYQPVVRVGDGSICAVEALARWTHPTRGAVGPDEFIPVAESSGLVVELGAWMLETACTQLARWRRTVPGAEALAVNVNASARQLTAPGFTDLVADVLERHGLPGHALGLEITESLLLEDGPAARRVLEALKEMRVRILLDDFGTGYSSLSYLKAFPVDYLKIDRSFVRGLGSDVDDTAIVTAIITMAHSLGLDVVGEGVETDMHRRRLSELGCDFGQGYYYARPMPANELEALLTPRVGS